MLLVEILALARFTAKAQQAVQERIFHGLLGCRPERQPLILVRAHSGPFSDGLDNLLFFGHDVFLLMFLRLHRCGDEEFNAPGEVLFRAFTPAAVTGALVFVLARHGS